MVNDNVKELVNRANEAMASGKIPEAIEIFSRVLETDRQHTHSHYCMTWLLQKKIAAVSEAAAKVELRRAIDNHAEQVLSAFTKDVHKLGWDNASIYRRTALVSVYNSLAWNIYEYDETGLDFARGIELARKGLDVHGWEKVHAIHDTYARLLLKLGRTDAAYMLVKRVLDQKPDFKGFQDFKENANWTEWLQSDACRDFYWPATQELQPHEAFRHFHDWCQVHYHPGFVGVRFLDPVPEPDLRTFEQRRRMKLPRSYTTLATQHGLPALLQRRVDGPPREVFRVLGVAEMSDASKQICSASQARRYLPFQLDYNSNAGYFFDRKVNRGEDDFETVFILEGESAAAGPSALGFGSHIQVLLKNLLVEAFC